jgi:hypothetical protein
MPGLVPGIHVLTVLPREKTWMAGTSPAMTGKFLEPRRYRPVFTLVQSRLMTRWVAGSRAVITNSFASVASSG